MLTLPSLLHMAFLEEKEVVLWEDEELKKKFLKIMKGNSMLQVLHPVAASSS
jgi:hypothetical protein